MLYLTSAPAGSIVDALLAVAVLEIAYNNYSQQKAAILNPDQYFDN